MYKFKVKITSVKGGVLDYLSKFIYRYTYNGVVCPKWMA